MDILVSTHVFLDIPARKVQRKCPANKVATTWELLFAMCCSAITSSYTVHHIKRGTESFVYASRLLDHNDAELAFVLDPSPSLMLGACLVLGCAVSSFAYRRQEQDRFQAQIFAVTTIAAAIVGVCFGVDTNLIMLGMVPWALCGAMISSLIVHWVLGQRICRGDIHSDILCELGEERYSTMTSSEKN